MSKMIIHNNSSMPDEDALKLVGRVISEGRASAQGKAYCYVTRFENKLNGPAVHAVKNKQSDTFYVEEDN